MSEYISREAFLEKERRLYCQDCSRRKNSNGKLVYEIGDAPCRACGIGDVLDDLEDIPAADVRPRWIPVKEQLIHSGWYLVACNEWGGSAVRKAIYDEATRKWLESPCGGPKDITKYVTHWMPLPEPPKEE